MMEPADLRRITRDWDAGFVANDNRIPDRYSEDEGIYAFIADTRRSVIRGLLLTAYALAVIVGMWVAFLAGWGKL